MQGVAQFPRIYGPVLAAVAVVMGISDQHLISQGIGDEFGIRLRRTRAKRLRSRANKASTSKKAKKSTSQEDGFLDRNGLLALIKDRLLDDIAKTSADWSTESWWI